MMSCKLNYVHNGGRHVSLMDGYLSESQDVQLYNI